MTQMLKGIRPFGSPRQATKAAQETISVKEDGHQGAYGTP